MGVYQGERRHTDGQQTHEKMLTVTDHQGSVNQKRNEGASLVVQWLRIRLPMQGARVQALVQEDPTCHGAAKPVCHNY